MKRRDFFKTSLLAGTALSVNWEYLEAACSAHINGKDSTVDLVGIMGGEPTIMLDKTLEVLGGIGKYVKPGDKVVLKPNIGWDRSPHLAANTNPELVKALVIRCLEAGASRVTVFDHTCDNWQKCYQTSGIATAVREAGGQMVPANDESYFREVSLPNALILKKTKIHTALLEADVWFNLPVLKNHGGAKLSCAMKNTMGIVWDRRFFHQNDLQQCIADICTWEKRPALNIVDAYRILFQNGPQGKNVSDTVTLKALIASSNIVATDTAAIGMFNQVEKLDLSAIGHLRNGEKMNLGSTDLSRINIKRIRL